jgi:hypothetical protein
MTKNGLGVDRRTAIKANAVTTKDTADTTEPKVLVVFNSSVPVSTPLSRYSSAHKSVILVANVS